MSAVRERVDVAIVGAGPAGLAAAEALRAAGAGRVVVLEREAEPGGIPRHAHHQGYGMRDLHRVMSGPDYARRRTERAVGLGAELRLGAQATGWSDDGALLVTSPAGRVALDACAVVLATGCRERPRSARLVAGARPQGVMTTGTLQQLVYLAGETPGRRAVVVGAEHVSFSAAMTLAHGGAQTVALVTEQARHQSYAAFALGARLRYGAPVRARTEVSAILGLRRVSGVRLTHLDTGAVEEVACDLVVFSADWIPDHELAVLGGAALDPGTRGPAVDAALRTSRPGLFAAGNVLHGAETADVAALAGRHVAAGVVAHLAGAPWPAAGVPLRCAAPLQWIAPNVVAPPRGRPSRNRYLLRAREELRGAVIEVRQGETILDEQRLRRVTAGRSVRLPVAWSERVDPRGGAVVVRVREARGGPSDLRR